MGQGVGRRDTRGEGEEKLILPLFKRKKTRNMEFNLPMVQPDLIPLDPKGEPKYNSIHTFNQLVMSKPKKAWIKTNKYSQNAKYIPIRIVEELLHGIFPFWQVEQVGEPKILGNSVVVSVNLKVYNPILGQWMNYAGVGAVPIELAASKKDEKGNVISGARNAIDFENINPKALHKNVPAAMSFAVSNAAKKIGRLFGSHLNSKPDETIR